MIPPLIPRPSDVRERAASDAFTFDAGVPIQLGSEATSETLFAARQLQSAIRDAAGIQLPIRKVVDPAGGPRHVALRVGGHDDLGPDGYIVTVSAQAITAESASEAGLFYAVQTLKQLLRTQGARVPALTIRDRPVLGHRGLMLDVSRGKVPTLAALFELVNGLAAYKYNHLELYIEHTFDFPSHPDIGAGCDPLTADDMLALDEYARARHVELVPNLQSFGHQRHMLSMPRYSHLDEVGWRWSLTPASEETYQLLEELYADFLPNFSSGWLNVDCDETWDLAAGQSKQLSERIGKGRVYLQHILRLRDLAAKHGRRIMLWADVLHHYPELVPELPDDTLLLDWHYEAADNYPTTAALGKSGREFWVCPGASSWNTLFPRLDNAIDNIRNFVRDGLAAGTTGMLLTDWGDYGHYSPLSLSWHPYIFGAATAWTGAQTTPEEFDAAFAPLFLGRPAGDTALNAMRRLGRAVTAPTLGLPNRSAIAIALFEDPLNGRVAAEADGGSLAELRAAALDAIAAWASLDDPELRQDYSFSARLIAFAASKALTAQEEVGRALAAPSAAALDSAITALSEAAARVPALRAEFEACWLRQARPSEIGLTLDHFDRLEQSYATALDWLRQRRAGAGDGAYAPASQPILWEQGRAELRKLADVAGVDSLPPEVRAWLERSAANA